MAGVLMGLFYFCKHGALIYVIKSKHCCYAFSLSIPVFYSRYIILEEGQASPVHSLRMSSGTSLTST